jgi:hypothetical protein
MDITSIIEQAISHNKILERLDGSGMGIVSKGEDSKLERNDAVRFLLRNLLETNWQSAVSSAK